MSDKETQLHSFEVTVLVGNDVLVPITQVMAKSRESAEQKAIKMAVLKDETFDPDNARVRARPFN